MQTTIIKRFIPISMVMILIISTYQCASQQRETSSPFVVEEVIKGLSAPWGMVFLTPKQLLITEKRGQLKHLDLEKKQLTTISGLPKIAYSGQGGFMDIARASHYKAPYTSEDWLYFTYAKSQKEGVVTTLARAKLLNNQLIQWQDMLITKSATNTGRHFGSRIAFDGKGHLFFSVGDRGERSNGQDLTTHAGSILRLNIDGTVPMDNPFYKNRQGLAEIFSYGHRNPQGLFYDHHTDRLWSIEHGPRGGDEINLIQAGLNYGWPIISYGQEYWGPIQVGEGTHKEGMEQPVKQYTPSIAPSSLIVYSGKAFKAWQGNLFAGALVLRHLNRVVLNDAGQPIFEERLLTALQERIRSVVESPEGFLYIATDSGSILRIRPSPK